jgi:hypothetical protein
MSIFPTRMRDELSVLEFEVDLVQVLGYRGHAIWITYGEHQVA